MVHAGFFVCYINNFVRLFRMLFFIESKRFLLLLQMQSGGGAVCQGV